MIERASWRGGWRRGWLPEHRAAGGAAFSPLSLSPTAWYDPSDISTLFQDSAGTVPVTASGDPVGRMLDKSPLGIHVTQATTAFKPIYTVAGAIKYLLFDGVDDILASAATPFGASIANATVSVAVREIVRQTSGLFALSYTSGAGDSSRWTAACPWVDGNVYFDCGATAAPGRISGAVGVATGADFIASFDNSVANTRQFFRIEKVQIASDASGETVTTAGPLSLGAVNLAGNFGNQRIYGMVAKVGTVMTAGELSNVETWLAAKQGRVL